jgi:hypothetical protein
VSKWIGWICIVLEWSGVGGEMEIEIEKKDDEGEVVDEDEDEKSNDSLKKQE